VQPFLEGAAASAAPEDEVRA